jgi:hypothetical protein
MRSACFCALLFLAFSSKCSAESAEDRTLLRLLNRVVDLEMEVYLRALEHAHATSKATWHFEKPSERRAVEEILLRGEPFLVRAKLLRPISPQQVQTKIDTLGFTIKLDKEIVSPYSEDVTKHAIATAKRLIIIDKLREHLDAAPRFIVTHANNSTENDAIENEDGWKDFFKK